MKEVNIERFKTNKNATHGILKVLEGGKTVFECKTIERGWLNNQRSISCIPQGVYNVRQTHSPRFKTNLYLVENVPNRASIRFHPANFSRQLNGCIALGLDFSDIDKDGVIDLTSSKNTHARFDSVMENKPFKLTIVNKF